MRLCKLLAVVATDPARSPLRLGQNGELHEIGLGHGGIEQAQCGGIDHVFGIVQHDEPERAPGPPLVILQRSVEPVQTIGLGGRPVALVDDDAEAWIASRATHHGFERRRVVAIAPDVEAQIGVRPGRDRMGDRELNDPVLVPRRNQDRRRPG